MNHKFILLGIINQVEGEESVEDLRIAPINTKIKDTDKALILCNHTEIIPILGSPNFSDMVHILKLKFFHGTIESPKKQKRKTVMDRRLGFSIKIKPSIQVPPENMNAFQESLIDDNFSSVYEESETEIPAKRSASETFHIERLRLIKHHEDFDTSINNNSFYPIIDKSINRALDKKFNYSILSESRYNSLKEHDMCGKISNHIILCGYNLG